MCEDQTQYTAALASAEPIAAKRGRPVETRILVGQRFHPAEAYHQKWNLRRHKTLFADLLTNYESEPQLLASMAAAKLNAYVRGSCRDQPIDLEQFGLSSEGLSHARSLWPQPQERVREPARTRVTR